MKQLPWFEDIVKLAQAALDAELAEVNELESDESAFGLVPDLNSLCPITQCSFCVGDDPDDDA